MAAPRATSCPETTTAPAADTRTPVAEIRPFTPVMRLPARERGLHPPVHGNAVSGPEAPGAHHRAGARAFHAHDGTRSDGQVRVAARDAAVTLPVLAAVQFAAAVVARVAACPNEAQAPPQRYLALRGKSAVVLRQHDRRGLRVGVVGAQDGAGPGQRRSVIVVLVDQIKFFVELDR